MDDLMSGGNPLAPERGQTSAFPASFKDYEDSFERDEIPVLRNDVQDAANMSVPERIVLSAGYDGDDSTGDVRRVTSDIFSEQAIPAPETAMMGMRAPPSTLTVDDSSSVYSRPAAGGMRLSDGDGSDRVQSPYRIQHNIREMQRQEEERSSDEELIADRRVAVGNENVHLTSYRGDLLTRLQRRVNYLERAVDDYRSASQIWNYALLALTIINPVILVYFFKRSK